MYLLYLDDSGSPLDPTSRYFVFGGVAVFERQPHWVDRKMREIARRFSPTDPESVEFHAGSMRSGKEGWQNFHPNDRAQTTVDILNLLTDTRLGLRVFAAVVDKREIPPGQVLEVAFEKVACAFDDFLKLLYLQRKEAARGLVIFDESDKERKIQALTHTFKHVGHTNGTLKNFAEVPLFIDSKASRLIQLADCVAYWIYRHYESRDSRGMELIRPHFHSAGGQQPGLSETLSAEGMAEIAIPSPQQYPFPLPTPSGVILPPVASLPPPKVAV